MWISGGQVVLKLQTGDLILMTAGVAAMLFMILMGLGKRDVNDAEAMRRSHETYLRLFNRQLSPVLVVALVLGLAAVAYVLLGAYYKVM